MPFFPERVTSIFLNMSFGEMWTFQKICSHKKRNILYWAIVWQVMGVSGEVLLWIQLALSFHWQTVSWCVSVQSSSVQSLSRVQLFSTHELQHARPPCPSRSPRVHLNPCPSSRWCHPAISSSVVPFSSCSQSLPAASGSFPMCQLFAWGGQSIGVSALAPVLPMNTH